MTVRLLEKLLTSEVENLHFRVDELMPIIEKLEQRMGAVERQLSLLWLSVEELHEDVRHIKDTLDTFMTKEDAKQFATKEDLQQFITKEDAKQFATKEDLRQFITKEDAKQFITKEDAKQFATKDDLRQFVTKQEFNQAMADLKVFIIDLFAANGMQKVS